MISRFKISVALLVVAMMQTISASAQKTISATTPQGRHVEVTAINSNTLKILNSADGQREMTANGLDANIDKDVKVTISHNGDYTTLSTGSVTARLNIVSGQLVINGGKNRTIIDNGLRNISGNRTELTLSTSSKGAYYGAGERGHKLNLRGEALKMYNRPTYGYVTGDSRINQMNITMPLFISTDGFALAFDDFAAGELILGQPITYISESPEAISYYFVNGADNIADVVENLTEITGRQDLPPMWALGYITSKYGYHTQDEATGVIDTLKREGYPVDGMVLDLYWYGKEQDMGRLDWEPQQWPNPEKMLSDFKEQGIHVVPISQPYVLRNGKGVDNYNKLAPMGIFAKDSLGNPLDVEIWVGTGGMFDVSNPDTKKWLANRYAELTDMGISGWWGDLGEPEQHPEGARHANGLTARQYHNRYGNDWSKIIYDLFAKKYPDRRLLSLMRGGTIGLQQYSVFPWSGDVSRSWGGMEPQIRIMLNSGLSGLGYMSHDVGGFAVDDKRPTDPELYVRWLQLGLFSPVLRTHSQLAAEPYHYPEYADIIKQLIDNRYVWLPYNYTLAYENATKGWPLVRPINFYDKGDSQLNNVIDEYLWGSEVLVAPILKEGAVSRDVLLPAGVWFDYYDPTLKYEGSISNYPAPLDKIPLFVKAGAFIPQAKYHMNSTSDYVADHLTIQYYPEENVESSYVLYDDNHISPSSLEEGQYRLVTFNGKASDGIIEVTISSTGTYPGAPAYNNYKLVFNGVKCDNVGPVSIENGNMSMTESNGFFAVDLKIDPLLTSAITVELKNRK